ncbi:MAG: hypothetical protein IKM66_03300 [Clostridia bacterium]|nr:hypothetical protein [Clostridia bacterium]
MKKTLSLFLVVVMLLGVLAFSVFAQETTYVPEKYSDEEYAAGFSFKCIYVIIKNEYSFEEFTPEKLGSDLISEIVADEFDPDNKYYDETTWELHLDLYLKDPSKKNVVELYKQMSANNYVKKAYIDRLDYRLPFFPESAQDIGFYTGEYIPWVSPDNENYIANGSNMLRNPYYQTFYNELLEYSNAIYKQFADYMGDMDYIAYFAENYFDKDENYVTLIFNNQIGLPDEEGAIRDYNISVLEKYFDKEEILYVGDTVFAAAVCIDKDNKDIIREIEELAFIGDAFFSDIGVYPAMVGTYTLGNVIGAETETYYEDPSLNKPLKKVSAADARFVLRYSAGLEKVEADKRFYFCADMNFDNEINSADARLILRTAAGLEDKYEVYYGSFVQWNDYMGSELKR